MTCALSSLFFALPSLYAMSAPQIPFSLNPCLHLCQLFKFSVQNVLIK